MNGEIFKPRRGLGAAHFIVGLASLVPAAYAGVWYAPVVLGPLWFCVLGVWLWRPSHRLRTALVGTHTVVGGLSLLNIAFGISSLHAADQATAKGGGPLGGPGYLPVICGVVLLILAAVTFWEVFAMRKETGTSLVPPQT